MPQVVAVVGGTGQQGGSVARALARHEDFVVRALTRDPGSPKALALKTECPNIHLVKADLDNKSSLVEALKGAYGCFVVTATPYGTPVESWRDVEYRHGKNIADACADVKVSHVIMSTMDPKIATLNVACPEILTKLEIFEYMKNLGLPVTGVMMGFYFENLMTVFKPKRIKPRQWGFGKY